MKVGIITFHRVLNYGAVLQTYALQQTLLKLGMECKIIDYRKDEFEKEYRNLKFDSLSLREIYHTLKCWMVRKKNVAFLNFIEKNLNLTEPCYNRQDLEKATKDLDILLTGSDQVFNYYTTYNDENYYLSFGSNKKKYSYAASFGFNQFNPKYDEQVRNWLNGYEQISVRENEAKQYLEKLLNRHVYLHCDPSFLLSKDEWKCFVRNSKRKKYVLVYSVGRSKALIDTAEQIAKKHRLEVLYIKYTYEKCGTARVITDASPEDFINLIYNAEYVVTNLFHGLAFSMILEKNFYLCIQDNVCTNSRLFFLLEQYNLLNRIVDESKGIIDKDIDYSEIRKRIEMERGQAKDYLKNMGI